MNIFFIHPEYLYGLLLIAIPIIVHLFNFRRYKTVYYSDTSFLQSVKEKSKSQSQLKHILILFSRIFFIISLVLIFSQPYLSENKKNSKNEKDLTVSIYIDNSFSSGLENENGILLENYKKNAISIADAYKGKAKFLLLTNNMPAKFLFTLNYNNLIDYISEITVTNKTKNIDEIISLNKDIIENIDANKLYILSDFQENFFIGDFNKYKNLKTNLIPSELSNSNNISVDTCWFESPNRKFGQKEKLFVKIKSFSNEDLTDLPVKLYINDSLKTVTSLNIEAGTEQKISFDYTNTEKGFYSCQIKIEDYPINFDNSLFFSYSIKNEINILGIGDQPNKYLESIFATEDYFSFNYQNNNAIEFSKFSSADVIILYGEPNISTGFVTEINKYIKKGGNFVLIPNTNKDFSKDYNQLLNSINTLSFNQLDTSFTEIDNIDIKIDLFKNLFDKIDNKTILPRINKHYIVKNNSYTNNIILNSKQNQALLIRTKQEKGYLYTFTFNAVSNNENSFNKSPILLPLLFNISLIKNANTLYHTINDNKKILYNNSIDGELNIKNTKYNIDFITRTYLAGNKSYLNIGDYIKHASNYSLYKKESKLGILSFNYDRTESNMSFIDIKKLNDVIINNKLQNWKIFESSNEHLSQDIENSYGKRLWYYFVIAALFFLFLETVFIRLFKLK